MGKMQIYEVFDKTGKRVALIEEGNNLWYVYKISNRQLYGENWSEEQAKEFVFKSISPDATFKNGYDLIKVYP